MSIEKKYCNLGIEVKEGTGQGGIPVGIVKGYLATWDIDRGNDQFVKGCFADAIRDQKISGKPIPLKDSHDRTIGIIPANNLEEDNIGLKVSGEINLDVQQGRESMSLIKQEAYGSWSIGYRAIDFGYEGDCRIIRKAAIWEGSVCDIPMNPAAVITEAKGMTRDKLPKKFAEKSYRWESADAEKRVRAWSGSDDEPSDKYKSAFIAVSGDDSEYSSYKMQIGDIIDGELKAIPRAIFSARVALTVNGGDPKSKSIINDLYKDMGIEQPFDDNGTAKAFFQVEISNMRKSDLTKALRYGNVLSADSASMVASALLKHTETSSPVGSEKTDYVEELKKLSRITQNATEDIHGRI
jgi:HK97 family phage prohead protease